MKFIKALITSLLFWLVIAIGVGVIVGAFANESVMQVVVAIRHIFSQFVMFFVPIILLGIIPASIVRMGKKSSRILFFSLGLAWVLVIAVSLFAMALGYAFIPFVNFSESPGTTNTLPDNMLNLNFPPIIPNISAMVLAILIGLGVVWTKSEKTASLLEELYQIVIKLIKRVLLPVIPIFIGAITATMIYEGSLTQHLPSYFVVILIALAAQLAWLVLIYSGATLYSRKNPFKILRHYGKPYLTAFGTRSSAATFPVAMERLLTEPTLKKDAVRFGIPFFGPVFIVCSPLSITLLVMAISQFSYGELPAVGTMLVFIFILSFFAVSAMGIPGGLVMASLAVITSVFGFTEVGIGLLIVLFALHEPFTTAHNITTDGAMVMILSKYMDKHEEQPEEENKEE
ncbi:MAG: dicarboxylate/amino acid:cation symporter [Firmicutes bacterium]|nr:dicarboxylate/amino acid:cation symporter [Bacillota bacterium]